MVNTVDHGKVRIKVNGAELYLRKIWPDKGSELAMFSRITKKVLSTLRPFCQL